MPGTTCTSALHSQGPLTTQVQPQHRENSTLNIPLTPEHNCWYQLRSISEAPPPTHAAAAIHLTAEGLLVGSQVSQKTITGQTAPCSGTPTNDRPDHTLPSTLRHPPANLLLSAFSGVSPSPIHQCGTVSQSLVTCPLLTRVSACHAVTVNV